MSDSDKPPTTSPYDRRVAAAPKSESHYIDPCQEAADKSLRCLRRNGGDRTMCQDFFAGYKECKERWMEDKRELKRLQREQQAAKGGWLDSILGR